MKAFLGKVVLGISMGIMLLGSLAGAAESAPKGRYTHPIKCVSHQGERFDAPSHSRPAYELAMQRKAEVVKLDVRFTKDGIAVLSHDSSLKRFLGWDVEIADKTLQEIKEQGTFLPVGGYEGEKLQTLAEALAIIKDCPEFWIDTKTFPPKTLERIFAEFDRFGIDHSRLMLATGNPRAILYAKKNFPDLRRVKHIYPQFLPKEGVVEHLLKEKEEFGLFGMNLPAKGFEQGLLTEADLQRLRQAGLWCSIWFVQESNQAQKYSEMGADAFVTDKIRNVRPYCRTPEAAPSAKE